MQKKINPRLIELARKTHNPELKIDETVLERQAEEVEIQAPDLEGYIYVPSINLYVAKERSLHDLNWNQTHKELHKQSLRMPTIREFVDFINYLRESYPNKQEAGSILDDILTVRTPWRAEWLDAKFEKQGEQKYISYNHRTVNGELVAQNREPLEKCLMKDFYPEKVDLASCNRQGLPTRKGNDINYWYPGEDSVAGFSAYSVRAYLDCSGVPEIHDASLGVRKVREAHSRSGK